MDKGYLKKNCVLGPGLPDGERGQEVSKQELGPDNWRKLIFNGAISEQPLPKKGKKA